MSAGTQIAGYRVVRRLGCGGYGEVYEAAAGARRVAIKLLLRAARDDAARFAREIRCVALLEHPNLPGLIDVGALADGRPYYVMELLAGATLGERVERGGPLPPAELAAVIGAIAGALDAAHARGIVHRDVKPSNVMLADRPVLLDFGIAKLLDDTNPALTRSLAVVGSPLTLSPEQLRGEPVDPRSDVYGLAVVAYFAACGRFPFVDPDPAVVERLVLTGEPPPIGRWASAPAALDLVLRRALAKDPAARPAAATAFADELARAAAGADAVAAFVELRPARPEHELDADQLRRLDAALPAAIRALAAHGLVVDAIAQDSALLIGCARACERWLDQLIAAARGLVAAAPVGELAITVARGALDRLRIVSSWLPAATRRGVVITSPGSIRT